MSAARSHPSSPGALVTATGDFTAPLLVAAGVALVFGCGSYGFIVGNLDRELDEGDLLPEARVVKGKTATA